jgi:hypothetical protein
MKQKPEFSLFKAYLWYIAASSLVGLGLLGTFLYVALHFIAKAW